jgi:hypothetical protein
MKAEYFRRTKYHNKSCRCRAGHYHQSVLEANYCDQLALLVKAGEILSYEGQVRYEFNVGGVHICDHLVDFVVKTKEGKDEVHEVKGFQTDVWRIKYKLFKALYPDTAYHIIAAGNSYFRAKR